MSPKEKEKKKALVFDLAWSSFMLVQQTKIPVLGKDQWPSFMLYHIWCFHDPKKMRIIL